MNFLGKFPKPKNEIDKEEGNIYRSSAIKE